MDKNWIEELRAIDNSITNEANALKEIISSLIFEPVIEFQLGTNMPGIPTNIFNKQGIYFFELKINEQNIEAGVWLENFSKLWKEGKVTWVPGIKKRRILAHQSLTEWIPLYLGKSKNVGGRITEHIHQIEGKTTFSMKLKARQNLLNEKFRVSWIPLNVKNYNMIAPAIETELRNVKNPIVGKQ
jgi:predicted transposase YbfD/YdcC